MEEVEAEVETLRKRNAMLTNMLAQVVLSLSELAGQVASASRLVAQSHVDTTTK